MRKDPHEGAVPVSEFISQTRLLGFTFLARMFDSLQCGPADVKYLSLRHQVCGLGLGERRTI